MAIINTCKGFFNHLCHINSKTVAQMAIFTKKRLYY